MLAVHCTPVNNTKAILKNGIAKSKKGLFCFPLTGHKALDRWWIYFFNQYGVRQRKKYNGFVFRLKQADMPAYFGRWVGATNRHDFDKEIGNLKLLKLKFRQTILWRLGEEIAQKSKFGNGMNDYIQRDELFNNLAEEEIKESPKTLANRMNSLDFMTYTLEDYQVVLSQSISPDRIIKVLPQGNEFGRVLKRQKATAIKMKEIT